MTIQKQIKAQIEGLKEQIRNHDYLYYVLSQPKISDKEYDDLMRRLKDLEERHPRFRSDDSPTMRLGAGILEGFKSVRHKQRMMSLDNSYSFQELNDWDQRLHKALGHDERIEYALELKIDGVSANITYEKGKMILASTRGDGQAGEDVTANIKTIRAIPLVLLGKAIPDFLEVRGEVYMEKDDFLALNEERKRSGEILFANPRNSASGSLKLLDTALTASRKLNFFAHSLGEYRGEDIFTQNEFLERLGSWGIRVNPHSKLCSDLKEVILYCQLWQEQRDRLSYEIDGVVVKINNFTQQKRLGFTMKSPRWAVAYKFPARQATTRVIKINIDVGRTGVITPVAELEPVECAGVVIRHATLHNFDEIQRLKIKKGDRVLIERAGDVIPKIVKVVESSKAKSFVVPRVCPACLGKVIREKEEDVAYRCINPSCPAQLERGLLHFSSRMAMDIEGMGEAVVSQLVRLGLVKSFADIYRLKSADLLGLELFKDKKANNLLAAIHNSRAQSLSRLIYALGIRHIGQKAAYLLAGEFKSLDRLMHAQPAELDKIYQVGPVQVESITSFFSQAATKRLIQDLRDAGVNFKEASSQARNAFLGGKSIVFTGELRNYSRQQAEDLVRSLGGKSPSAVSKNTDFVVAGENPGSKYDQAVKLGVKIINEDEFREIIE
jgi:DNA ligase (NAD+)